MASSAVYRTALSLTSCFRRRETSKDSVRWATMSEPDSGADVLQAALNESHRKAIGIRGKQGSPRLDPENTDDHHVPPFLCQSVAGK
jgi:hypothetical protein